MNGTPIITIVPVLAALITGTLGLLGLIITKESKVSEFRQLWIDALRADVAELLAALHQVLGRMNNLKGKEDSDENDKIHESLRDANTALFLTRLRLNDREDKSSALIKLLDEAEDFSNNAENGSYDSTKAVDIEKRILVAARLILKEEWDRVRNGEPTYKKAKFVAITIVGILFLAFVALVFIGDRATGDKNGAQPLNRPAVSVNANFPVASYPATATKSAEEKTSTLPPPQSSQTPSRSQPSRR